MASVSTLPGSTSFTWVSVLADMTAVLDPSRVLHRREELLVYECDGLASYRQVPAMVVLPQSTEEVVRILQVCQRHQVPFVARGSGTGLSGGALPVENCVVITTSLMKQILSIDLENQRITVQPGVINTWITQAIAAEGYYYAPDPSSQSVCSIGGNIAENSGGVHCLKYGVTTNHVVGLTVVLPSGDVVRMGGSVPENPGFDLAGLFVGSEGTLGIATEITLRILKSPEHIQVLLADFETVEQAGSTVSDVIAAGIIPAGMEIMDNFSINAVEDVVATNCYPRDAGSILLIEVDGSQVDVDICTERITALCYRNKARSVQVAMDPEERLRMWKGRKAAFAAMGKMSPNYFVQDGVIPRSQLPFVLGRIAELSQMFGYPVANVFHAGDGNLHPLILYNESDPGALEQVEQLGGEILKLCVQVGGSISGEHGIGADKRCYMPEMFSHTDLETMKWVRHVFDPHTLANPTKVFPSPRTCSEAAHAHHHIDLDDPKLASMEVY